MRDVRHPCGSARTGERERGRERERVTKGKGRLQ